MDTTPMPPVPENPQNSSAPAPVPAQTPTPVPSTSPAPAASTPAPMPVVTTTTTTATTAPAPVVTTTTTPQVTTTSPSATAPKPPLTPEQKAAARKTMMKRAVFMLGSLYVLLLVFIFAWASFLAKKPVGLFSSLGLSQIGFQKFLMNVAHVEFVLLVAAALGFALISLFRSLMAKKEDIEKKKKFSRRALYGGLIFLLATILWLGSIIYLSPKLTPEQRYQSYIVTDPEETIGLTAPVEITFDATELPINQNTYQILSYTWLFGDGSTGSGPIVTHRYTKKPPTGTYTVTVTVLLRDIRSGAQTEQQFTTLVAIENEATAASFTARPESGVLPLEVEFDASASYDPDGQIISYEWDLDGDGSFDDATGVRVTHTYTEDGIITVSLKVTDNNGQSNVVSSTIEAGTVGGLRAVITAPLQSDEVYRTGEKYAFSGDESSVEEGNITKYIWDFGDGTAEVQSRKASHTFEEEGTFTIELTVYDEDGNLHTDELEIEVKDVGTAPTAKITTIPVAQNNKVTGAVPFEVTFSGAASTDPEDDIVDYEWDFDNDGEIDDTGESVSFTFDKIALELVILLVRDSAGNENETSIEVDVTEQGVVARLSASVTSGEVPLTVTFDSSASTYKEGSIVSYEYDFGDGSDTYIGGSKVSYKYTDVGNFTVTMTAVGDDGTRDDTTLQIVVRPVSLTACFTTNVQSGSAPLFVSPDPSCSKGTIQSYVWDFGDGEISFDRKPETHTYTDTGVYTLSLEITSPDGIVDTFEQTITVR